MAELLRVENLRKRFVTGGPPWARHSVAALDDVSFSVERGRTLERNMCTDLIDGESEPEWVRTATAGRGHLVVGEFDPVTWRARATLTLEGVEGPDGLRFAPAELSTDQIGFFSG